MKNSPNTYFITVIVDTELDQIIGAGTILVEQKFIHGCGEVRVFKLKWRKSRCKKYSFNCIINLDTKFCLIFFSFSSAGNHWRYCRKRSIPRKAAWKIVRTNSLYLNHIFIHHISERINRNSFIKPILFQSCCDTYWTWSGNWMLQNYS